MKIPTSKLSGGVLDKVQAGEVCLVTYHNRPRAIVIRFPVSYEDLLVSLKHIQDVYAHENQATT